MRIAYRLAMLSLLLIAVTVAVGALGLSRMHQIDANANEVAHRFAKAALAQRGLRKINENARVTLHLFFVADAGEFAQQVDAQRETSREITEIYRTIEEQLDGDDERASFAKIVSARTEYTSERAKAESALRDGNAAEAKTLLDTKVLPKLDLYIRAWDDFLILEGNRVDQASRDTALVYERSRAVTLVLVVAAILGAASLAFIMTRQITKPISNIASAARKLEKGTLVRIDIESTDEIGDLARAFNIMGEAVAFREERLQREMNLAQHIQTALLPKEGNVVALDVASGMQPATEVGGDYYDVLPTSEGCWLGMGDVAGHGLDAGLIMLMLQSTIAALVRSDPNATPRSVLTTVNRVVHENVRERMNKVSHATLVLLRVSHNGDVVFAGAHEDILVWRAKNKRCEIIETPGTWVGGAPDIEAVTIDSSLHLDEGDTLVLFTDGMTEARNAKGDAFGLPRLCEAIEAVSDQTVDAIRDHLFRTVRAWSPEIDDDLSLLIARLKH